MGAITRIVAPNGASSLFERPYFVLLIQQKTAYKMQTVSKSLIWLLHGYANQPSARSMAIGIIILLACVLCVCVIIFFSIGFASRKVKQSNNIKHQLVALHERLIGKNNVLKCHYHPNQDVPANDSKFL